MNGAATGKIRQTATTTATTSSALITPHRKRPHQSPNALANQCLIASVHDLGSSQSRKVCDCAAFCA